MSEKVNNKSIPLIIGVSVFCLLVVFSVFAWTGPPGTPPDPNAPAPINATGTGQVKRYVDSDSKGWLGISIPDGQSYDSAYGLTVGSASNPLGIKTSGDSFFGQNLTAMGNVGIGATNPGQSLSVSGNVETNQVQSWMGSDLTLRAPGGWIGSADIYITPGIIGGAYRDVIMAENGGRVGIGTPTPTYELDVDGDISARQLCLKGVCQSSWAGVGGGGGGWVDDGTVVRLETASDNIGIGITSPAEKLHISGGNLISNTAFVGESAYSGYAYFGHKDNRGTGNYALLQHPSSHTYLNARSGSNIYFRNNNSDRGILYSNGNLWTDGCMYNYGSCVYGEGMSTYVMNTDYWYESGNDGGWMNLGTSNAELNIRGSVRFDCPSCGSTSALDGSTDWGDLTIQGRVISANSNIHLSPPGGNNVIINDTYRAAGGSSTGGAGLSVEGDIITGGEFRGDLGVSSCYWNYSSRSTTNLQQCNDGYYLKGIDLDVDGTWNRYRIYCCRP